MLLYDFIENISGLDLINSKVVLNSPIEGFNPTVRLVDTINGNITDELYSETAAWNGSGGQQFSEGQLIVQLVKVSQNRYIFGTVARVTSAILNPNFDPNDDINKNKFKYSLEKIGAPLADFYGALEVVLVDYKVKQANKLWFHKLKENFIIRNQAAFISEFPGYDNVNVTFDELEVLINTSSWRSALQNQKGVYLLRDRLTGKQYVGSAYGKEMLWQRWNNYLASGHGGDKGLIPLGKDYISRNFSFVILATFNADVSNDEIIRCESAWKEKLGTRVFGYNEN